MISVQVGDRKYSLTKIVASAATVVGGGLALWAYAGEIGSSIPRGRQVTDATHARLEAAIAEAEARLEELVDASLMAANQATNDFRAEWRCDEHEEELAELEARAADLRERGEPVPPEVTRRIERLREIIGPENMNCAQFEIDD